MLWVELRNTQLLWLSWEKYTPPIYLKQKEKKGDDTLFMGQLHRNKHPERYLRELEKKEKKNKVI